MDAAVINEVHAWRLREHAIYGRKSLVYVPKLSIGVPNLSPFSHSFPTLTLVVNAASPRPLKASLQRRLAWTHPCRGNIGSLSYFRHVTIRWDGYVYLHLCWNTNNCTLVVLWDTQIAISTLDLTQCETLYTRAVGRPCTSTRTTMESYT